jgi:hypothetical protein
MRVSKRTIYCYISAAILSLTVTACGLPEDEPDVSAQPQQGTVDGSSRVMLVDFASARSTRLPVAQRVQRASRVLLAGAAETTVVQELQHPETGGAAKMVARPTLRMSHVPEADEVLLINGPVADDHSEGADIGEAAARQIFDATVAQLARDGLDDMNGLDLAKATVSRLREAAGQAGRPDTLRSHVKAYVFSAPRTVNGLEVLHSNVTIGVHRSGKLALIHSRGVLPGKAPANAVLASRPRVVSAAEIQKRAQAEFPGASLQSLGLVYVVDPQTDAKLASAVEPREVFVVFPPLNGAAGYGRGRSIAYSVTDARAPVMYLDTQLKNDPGDTRP